MKALPEGFFAARRPARRVEPAFGWPMALVGLALFFAPGAAWAAFFGRALGGPARVALAVLLSFTIVPAAMFVLDVLFGVPVTRASFAMLALVFALAGALAWWRRHSAAAR